MDLNIGVADFCLKFDHRKYRLHIYINKFQLTCENPSIDKVCLSFQLLPTNRKIISQWISKTPNDIYFIFYESLVFKNLDPTKMGTMGLIVVVYSYATFYKKIKLADNYQPLDNLDLTSHISRVILSLTSENVNYKDEYLTQNHRMELRQTSDVISSTCGSQDPMIALAFKYHPKLSRIDVYIQRLTRINLYVSNGYISLGFMAHISKIVSTNRSKNIHFFNDNLIHESIPLDTKDVNLNEGGIFIQICPLKKNDIQIQSVEYQKNFGVLYAMFGSESYSALPAKIIWNDVLSGITNHKNRWHVLKVGGINV